MPRIVTLMPSDAGEVLTLQRAAYVTEAQAHQDLDLASLHQSPSELETELADPEVIGVGWRDTGRLVAAVRARIATAAPTVARIGRLTVAPDRQRQGLASRLLTILEDRLPASVTDLALFTGERNEGALRLYDRLGYHESGREQTSAGYALVHLHRLRRCGAPDAGTTGTHSALGEPRVGQLLGRTNELALRYLESVGDRPVSQSSSMEDLAAALGGPLPPDPSDPVETVESLAYGADPGLVVTNGGRYFGFVEGGVLPVALAADWLTSTWDQNPGFFALSPAAAAVEEVCRGWLCDLLGLPPDCSAGFTTGAQMANFTGLAIGLRHVLHRAGWDVDAHGLVGAPPVTVIAGQERHATVDRALRFLGIGHDHLTVIPANDQGRMYEPALADALDGGPAIVCAQAGNVNTGSFDPLRTICQTAHAVGAWVHIDGAFGLWAAASPARRHLTDGAELADSWATDGHKWLNVPYDCGIVLCAHPDSHRSAMTLSAAYLAAGDRDGADWTPESSRRARAFPVWAALRSLGRRGVADLVDGCCKRAHDLAEMLAADPEVTVVNDVLLNQVLIRIGDDDARTTGVAEAVQAGGQTWLGTTVFRGQVALRISVSDHATTDHDIQTCAAELLHATHP